MRRHDRELSDISEIEEVIKKSDVCRIAIANGDMPYMVTMNFGYTGHPERTIYFHCASEGKKLEMIKRNNYVCFSFDTDHKLITGENACDWGMSFSSVVGYGNISIITDIPSKRRGLDCIMSQYSGKRDFIYDEKVLQRTKILSLDIKEITGKKC